MPLTVEGSKSSKTTDPQCPHIKSSLPVPDMLLFGSLQARLRGGFGDKSRFRRWTHRWREIDSNHRYPANFFGAPSDPHAIRLPQNKPASPATGTDGLNPSPSTAESASNRAPTPIPPRAALTNNGCKFAADLYGAFPVKRLFWVVLRVFCSERERPFFVPSPAIRSPERAEGVKGPKR